MTIGKKLYFGFGAILAIMLVLFVINVITVRREYSAQDTVKATLAAKQSIDDARFQMMENRLYLSNYLLSGDLRDEDKTNKGVGDLLALLKDAQAKSLDTGMRAALAQVGDAEASWAENFAKPMIAKRHQVDAGDATVSDLQIYYLQHDPASWINKSTAILDQADQSVRRAQEDSNASSASATMVSAIITTLGTLFAVALGGLIAFY